jgi:catechol 2,3-dioxygenase-like lactoylglutathione lyase family enzyme
MWKALQIYHVNVNCTNLERSLAFYQMLGFREVIDIPAGRLRPRHDPAIGRALLLRLGEEPRSTLIDLIEWQTPRPHGTPTPTSATRGSRACACVKGLAAMVAELKSRAFGSSRTGLSAAGGKQTFVCFRSRRSGARADGA